MNLLYTAFFKPCEIASLPLSVKQSETWSDFKNKTKPVGDIDCSFLSQQQSGVLQSLCSVLKKCMCTGHFFK